MGETPSEIVPEPVC